MGHNYLNKITEFKIVSPEDDEAPSYLTNLAMALKSMGNIAEARNYAEKASTAALSRKQEQLLNIRIVPLITSLNHSAK